MWPFLIYMRKYSDTISDSVFNPSFVKGVFRGTGRNEYTHWNEVIVRSVKIKNRLQYQFSFFDDKKDITKNYKEKEARYHLGKVLRSRITGVVITLADRKIQFESRGREVVRHVHKTETKPDFLHDKKQPEVIPLSEPFLEVIGFTTTEGKIAADKKDKWKQVTEFIAQIALTCSFPEGKNIQVVDYGCGNAYLTFCLYYYLSNIRKLSVEVIGIDRNPELVNANIGHAKQVGFENLTFIEGDIDPNREATIDIAVALHACDTATDDALISAVNSGAKYIFISPCCHHHLQSLKQVGKAETISRFPILKERMADIVTDTARALAVGAHGYDVEIIEFVPDIHTPRNVLIKAAKNKKSKTREHYDLFISSWGITPYIEKLFK